MRQNILCYVFASARLCGSASKWALKNGDDEAAADISECAQIQQSRKATYILKVMSMMVYVLRSQVFFFNDLYLLMGKKQ